MSSIEFKNLPTEGQDDINTQIRKEQKQKQLKEADLKNSQRSLKDKLFGKNQLGYKDIAHEEALKMNAEFDENQSVEAEKEADKEPEEENLKEKPKDVVLKKAEKAREGLNQKLIELLGVKEYENRDLTDSLKSPGFGTVLELNIIREKMRENGLIDNELSEFLQKYYKTNTKNKGGFTGDSLGDLKKQYSNKQELQKAPDDLIELETKTKEALSSVKSGWVDHKLFSECFQNEMDRTKLKRLADAERIDMKQEDQKEGFETLKQVSLENKKKIFEEMLNASGDQPGKEWKRRLAEGQERGESKEQTINRWLDPESPILNYLLRDLDEFRSYGVNEISLARAKILGIEV